MKSNLKKTFQLPLPSARPVPVQKLPPQNAPKVLLEMSPVFPASVPLLQARLMVLATTTLLRRDQLSGASSARLVTLVGQFQGVR